MSGESEKAGVAPLGIGEDSEQENVEDIFRGGRKRFRPAPEVMQEHRPVDGGGENVRDPFDRHVADTVFLLERAIKVSPAFHTLAPVFEVGRRWTVLELARSWIRSSTLPGWVSKY